MSAPDSFRLTDTLEFMQLLWAMVHALERTSKRMAADVGVTGPQRLVLRVVGLAPQVSPGELAAVLHVHPSTLTGVLERLVSQRLLTRVSDPGDRRRARLTLTAKGVRINAVQQGTAEAAVSDALVAITASERGAAKRVLQRLTTGSWTPPRPRRRDRAGPRRPRPALRPGRLINVRRVGGVERPIQPSAREARWRPREIDVRGAGSASRSLRQN